MLMKLHRLLIAQNLKKWRKYRLPLQILLYIDRFIKTSKSPPDVLCFILPGVLVVVALSVQVGHERYVFLVVDPGRSWK